jgi:arylsulfatase A-like enzyme
METLKVVWNILLGILLAYLALLLVLPHAPRFYLPGLIVSVVNPPETAGSHDWLAARSSYTSDKHNPSMLSLSAAEDKPNILLIIVDDLGINDLSGGAGIATPNIDSIRYDGVNFIQSYSGHATCAPSRAAIMTGRYATRFGFEFTPIPKHLATALAEPDRHTQHNPILHEEAIPEVPFVRNMGVPTTETFLSDKLKQANYTTYMLGKWHLGESHGHTPAERGFDYSAVFLPGASLYLPLHDPQVVNARMGGALDDFLIANLEFAVRDSAGHKFAPGSYMTDFLSDEAARAIQKHASKVMTAKDPFFIKLSYNAVHNPLQALRSDYEVKELQGIDNHIQRVYAAMILALDRGVGKVLRALDEANLRNNTLVIFTSDNGGTHFLGLPHINAPYRGWKATLFEGGIRVPMYMRWPDKIEAGSEYQKMVAHVDIFATTVAAAGLDLASNLDGVNLLDYITIDRSSSSEERDPHSILFWRSGHNKAIRTNSMKYQVSARPPKLWLFNLTEDPTERNNIVYNVEPDIVDVLCEDLEGATVHTFCDLDHQLHDIDEKQAKPLWPELIEVPVPIDRTSHDPPVVDEEYVYWAN